MYKFITAILLSASAFLCKGENLLYNNDFKHNLAGYILGDTGDMRVVPHRFNKTEWGNSITFPAKPSERVALYLPEVPYKPETEYKISFMAKSSSPIKLIISQYVRVGIHVGSAGKYFPEIGTEWKRYSFTYKTGNKEKWGGFRIVKNYNNDPKTVELSFADLYLGPVDNKKVTTPVFSRSFQWDPLDRRIVTGNDLKMPVRIYCNLKSSSQQTVTWSMHSLDGNKLLTVGELKEKINPGINDFYIHIPSGKMPNGTFRLNAKINEDSFINNVKFTVCPRARVKPGELPVDIGLNNIFSMPSKKYITDAELSLIADCGVSFIRTWDGGNPFIWRNIEPQENDFNFTYADRLVEAINRAGMETLVVLGGMCFAYPPKKTSSHALPKWLYEKSEIVSCPPNMFQFTRMGYKTALPPLKYWERFVANLSKRYKGKVQYYEVMNESNLFFTEKQYLPYLRSAYSIIKQNDPSATVVGICATGDYDGHIISYVDGVLKLGAGKYIDALSFHAYQCMFEDSRQSGEDVIKAFYKFLKTNKLDHVKLWNTELYYLNPKAHGGSDHKNGPRYHPGYLIRRYLLDAAQGVRASISVPGSHLQEICLINENFQENSQIRFFNNRLLPNNKYVASAVFSNLLRGTTFVETVVLGDEVRAYTFSGKNKAVAAVFSLYTEEDEKRRLTLAETVNALDILGNLLDTTKERTASPVPFYITAKSIKELNLELKKIRVYTR